MGEAPQLDDDTTGRALAEELVTRARDAAYTAVGLGILGFQRLQVRRHSLVHHLTGDDAPAGGAGDELRAVLATGASRLDGWMEGTLALVDAGLQPIEDQLPGPARQLVTKGRALGSHLHQLVKSVA